MTILLIVVFGISGCCNHRWQEADCEQAAVCAVCGEEDGAPLGHDWVQGSCGEADFCARCGISGDTIQQHEWQANCEEPIICVHCGEDSGDIQKHSWEDEGNSIFCLHCGEERLCVYGHIWVEIDCRTPKFCSVCGVEDDQRPEHTWKEVTCQELRTCVVCGETSGYISEKHFFGAWEQTGEEVSRSCTICGIQDLGGTVDSEANDFFLPLLIDNWEGSNDRHLSIREDGTFTGDFDGNITGTWDLHGVLGYRFREDICRYGLTLSYEKNGVNQSVSGSIYISATEKEGYSYKLYLDALSASYWKPESQEHSGNTDANSEGITAMAGYWTSCSVTKYTADTYFSWEQVTTEYAIDILADGTFTAQLSQNIKGQMQTDTYSSVYCDYTTGDGESASLFFGMESDHKLIVSSMEDDALVQYCFTHMTEAEKQTFEEKQEQNRTILDAALPGEWIAKKYTIASPDTDYTVTVHPLTEDPYRLTFCPDGTFYGTVMYGEIRGSWFYSGTLPEKNSEVFKVGIRYNYEDQGCWDYDTYFDDNGFYLYLTGDGGLFTYYFEKLENP